jgi:ribosomal protein L16 Arg81 hydroxylase
VYLRTCDEVLPHVSDVLAQGIPTDDRTLEGVSVYLSQAHTVTNLHWDLRSGAIQQLRGRKRVLMFAPSEIANLPMYAADHIFGRRSRIDGLIDAAALENFPALKQARGFICELGPGDWLYLPAGWLHHVTTCDDDCISLIATFCR